MSSIIIGTAGHIDHGKSALVQALTGKDPDRLPEEKQRGITIDLGFADLDLGTVRVAFVDVPGHERFIKNMLAGAQGIDLVALVIAADEGVMPQTREHFDICRLLNVKTGLIVITKTDLVDADLISLVRAEAKELVQGSFLANSPMVTVSAKTGAGLDELKTALRETALRTPPRASGLIPRLPVDRSFTVKGFGAVVTGTLVSGEIKEADELELLPGGIRVRARGLQVHGRSVERALAGQRTAINLGGVDVFSIQRGMILAPVGCFRPTQILDVHLNVLPGASRPLRSRSRIRFYIHAAEALGRIRVLNKTGELAPGQSGFAQVRLESPTMAISEERFIIRSYSPPQTVAGGQILDPFASKHRARDLHLVNERLSTLLDGNQTARFSAFVEMAEEHGRRLSDLVATTGWNITSIAAVLKEASTRGTIVDCDGVYLSSRNFEHLHQAVLREVNSHHQREPLSRGLGRETLRERVFAYAAPEIFRTVLAAGEKRKEIVLEKEIIRARDHSPELSDSDVRLRDRLEQIYKIAGLEPPSPDDALKSLGLLNAQRTHGRKLLQFLIDGKTIIRVQGDLFFHQQALERLKRTVHRYGEEHEPLRSIDVASFKELAGVSRKYAIPLLEYLDRERITRREGDRRIILKG